MSPSPIAHGRPDRRHGGDGLSLTGMESKVMTADAQGNPLSGATPELAELFDQAVAAFNIYRGDPVGLLDQAIAAAPGFAMAHIFKAHLLGLATEPGATKEAKAIIDTVRTLPLSEREASHVEAIELMVAGEWTGAATALDRHNFDYPHDLVALQSGHLMDFYRANARSLRGGSLLMTPLKGVNGEVYAVAQGNLIVGGFGAQGRDGSKITVNVPSVGRIPGGALVERTVDSNFGNSGRIIFNLHAADFTTAKRMALSINDMLGPNVAEPLDAVSVSVQAPQNPAQRVDFLSLLENLEVQPGEAAARVVINSRTGTIVVGQHVRVSPVAITHGSLTVTVTESVQISQPNALGRGQTVAVPQSAVDVDEEANKMFRFSPSPTLDDIVRAVNEVGAAPGDLMAILEALRQAGALRAEIMVI